MKNAADGSGVNPELPHGRSLNALEFGCLQYFKRCPKLIPNLVIYTVRFVSTFAVVFYHDPMFALLALIGMPVSMLMSKTLLHRMKGNNERSAAMSAKMSETLIRGILQYPDNQGI